LLERHQRTNHVSFSQFRLSRRFNDDRSSDVWFLGMLEHGFSNIIQTAAPQVCQPARGIQDLERIAVATTCSEFGSPRQGDVQ
jgi:hypothetical protein